MTTRNLYQKLAAIASEVGAIKATGKTAQGGKTLSISDIEDVLRPLMGKHGLVTGYTWNAEPKVVEVYERGGKVYQVDLTVWMVNADAPEEKREDRTIDFASTPSGAISFALKRYYRAVFHLADEDEEDKTAGGRPTVPVSSGAPGAKGAQRPPAPAPKDPLVAEAEAKLGAPGSPQSGVVPPSSPEPPAAQDKPQPGYGAMLDELRLAGRALKSPATDLSLLAMARGKWRGKNFRRLEDLTPEQVRELTKAVSGLVDVQNAGAQPPAREHPPAEEAGGQQGTLNPDDEDVPF